MGAALLVLGGVLIATAISGTTGSFLAVFLAPGALSITNPVAGTYRSAGGQSAILGPLSTSTPPASSTTTVI